MGGLWTCWEPLTLNAHKRTIFSRVVFIVIDSVLQLTHLRHSLLGINNGNNGNSLLVFLDLGMDDEGDDDPVPLPNVNAAILKKVTNYIFVYMLLFFH